MKAIFLGDWIYKYESYKYWQKEPLKSAFKNAFLELEKKINILIIT